MQKYDVIIKSGVKDYYKLPWVVDSLKWLDPQPEGIYIISPDGVLPDSVRYGAIMHAVKDEEVFPGFDRKRIKHRPNWCTTSLMALFQDVTKNDLYLDVQSDNIFTKEIDLFTEDKPNIFISPQHAHYHEPYFRFSQAAFNLIKDPINTDSFTIEFMMYDKNIAWELIASYEDIDYFLDYAVSIIDENCYPADQEAYGNWCLQKHFGDHNFIYNVQAYIGSYYYPKEWTAEEVLLLINDPANKNYISMAFHTWLQDEKLLNK